MTDQITIKAAPTELRTHSDICAYVDKLIEEREELYRIRYALTEIVNSKVDDTIEIHTFPADKDEAERNRGFRRLDAGDQPRRLQCLQGAVLVIGSGPMLHRQRMPRVVIAATK